MVLDGRDRIRRGLEPIAIFGKERDPWVAFIAAKKALYQDLEKGVAIDMVRPYPLQTALAAAIRIDVLAEAMVHEAVFHLREVEVDPSRVRISSLGRTKVSVHCCNHESFERLLTAISSKS